MPRISLIVVRPATDQGVASDLVAATQLALKSQGHSVEVIPVDPTPPAADLAVAAIDGLRQASGDHLVVVDPLRGYSPNDLVAVVDRLMEDADLAVAIGCRPRRGFWSAPGAIAGRLIRLIGGSSDPLSGLIGLRAEAARQAAERFKPIGARFALEILARVEGNRADVVVEPLSARDAAKSPGLNFSDIRQAKRLADDRFGLASRLAQFCVVGASGMVVDLACYALFQRVFASGPMAGRVAPIVGGPLAPAAAGVVAVAIALSWNFALNRRLTFNDARNRAILPAFFRYALSNLVGVTLSLTLRLCLPNLVPFFGRHRLAAAVVGIVAATGVSFTLTRWFVFGRPHPQPDSSPKPGTPTLDATRRGTEILA